MEISATWLMLLAAGGMPVLLWAAPSTSDPSRGLLLVVNKFEHTLSIVDPKAGKELSKITTGVNGHEVAASPDGRFAYVPVYGNSAVGQPGTNGKTIDVIDVAGRRLSTTIDLGKQLRPHCAVFGLDGLLYVTAELAGVVDVVNPHTGAVVGSIPTRQPESHMLALSRDGKRAYTANNCAGTVTTLDLENRRPIASVPVSKKVQRISLSVDDSLVFTADQIRPRLAVIDTGVNRVKTWIALPGIGFGTCPTLDGRWLLATLPRLNKVAAVDLRSMSVARTVDVPEAPQEILMRPDGQVAYISCDTSEKVAALNLNKWVVEKLITVGSGADGLAWAPLAN